MPPLPPTNDCLKKQRRV